MLAPRRGPGGFTLHHAFENQGRLRRETQMTHCGNAQIRQALGSLAAPIAVVHRTGELQIGEVSVAIAVLLIFVVGLLKVV